MKLLSRERVVDGMFMSFKDTHLMPWLLPEVQPPRLDVEVARVVIACAGVGSCIMSILTMIEPAFYSK